MKQVDFEQELYKRFGQVKDFTLGMRIAKYFYEMGRKSQWISTNERLPEEEFDDGYTFVFVRIKINEDTYQISTDYIRNGKWELHRDCNITHWMTIPSI